MITWCVARTQPFKEIVAQQHLLDQGYEVYMPRFKKMVRHARKVEEKLAPLFPRYIFVGMNLSTTGWRSVNGTRGVSRSRIIDDLRAQEIGDGIVPASSLVNFVQGEKVRIVDGAFADQMAVFEFMDDRSRVQLLLTFMGREMKMTLPNYAVEAA